jgi:O-succinylhomoserine sulfhydrylase
VREETRAVRGGIDRTPHDETSEALFLTSGYVYGSAAEAEAAFAGDVDRFVYSRYGNPTVRAFEERLRGLEGAEDAFGTASGMAAVFNALLAVVVAGDRIVAARNLFGSCLVILTDLLPRLGVLVDFVDGSDLEQWADALARPASAVFFETPSNPMLDIVDIAGVSTLAHAAGAVVVVDNVFATPILQRPGEFGADVVVYSGTKHIDGQGRVLGGAILGSTGYIREQVEPWMRHTGPALSPFNAWVLLKGLETLPLRVRAQSASAATIAEALAAAPGVRAVHYPGRGDGPRADLARRQMSAGGTVVTVELEGGRERAFDFIDRLQIADISNNLGDVKTLVTHPASSTHRSIGPEARAAAGITDGVVRLSVGLEATEDLLEDLMAALVST